MKTWKVLGKLVKLLHVSVLMGVIFSFAGCKDKEDYMFDYGYVKDLYDKTFPVQNISPDQDWKTTRKIRANVTVNGLVGMQYSVRFYLSNPLSETDNTRFLSMNLCGGTTESLSFDVPAFLETIFVIREDNDNRYVKAVDISKSNTVDVSFDSRNAVRSMARSVTPGADPFPLTPFSPSLPSDEELLTVFPAGIPEDAIEEVQGDQKEVNVKITKGGNYVINFWSSKQVKVYIAAKNVTLNSINMPFGNIYIMEGDEVEISASLPNDIMNISVAENAILRFKSLSSIQGASKWDGGGELPYIQKLYNRGTVDLTGNYLNIGQYAQVFNYTSGNFVNVGGISSSGKSIEPSLIYNEGNIGDEHMEGFSIGGWVNLYNAASGTISVQAAISSDGGAVSEVYNAGKIKAGCVLVTNGNWVNDGDIDTKTLTVDKYAFENNGNLSVEDDFILQNVGDFYNTGITKIGDDTSITNTNCYWINKGYYTTEDMKFQGGNKVGYNYCRLIVQEKLEFTGERCAFNLMGGYVTCKDVKMQNTVINLESNSILEIQGNVEVESPGINDQGFHGDGSEQALLKIGKMSWKRGVPRKEGVGFYGNLLFAIDEPLKEVELTSGDYPTIMYDKGAVATDYDALTINAGNEEECNPGWDVVPVDPKPVPDPNPGDGDDDDDDDDMIYTYCYEDYFPRPGDYDFNDIVMDVSMEKDYDDDKLELELKIKLVAVGATMKLGSALQIVGVKADQIDEIEYKGDDKDAFVGTLKGPDNDLFKFSSEKADPHSLEQGSNGEAVIPLFADAHKVLTGSNHTRYMCNTAEGHESGDYSYKKLKLKIKFKSKPDITLEDIDIFVAKSLNGAKVQGSSGNETRIEIHLLEFWANKTPYGAIFGLNEQAALESGPKTWALRIPNFRYPYETVNIKDAYNQSGHSFEEWAQGNGSSDWYEWPVSGKTYR